MLYQTLPLFFPLNPCSSSSSSSPVTGKYMDCFEEKALKTSFWPEHTMKVSPQVFPEDLWCGGGGANGASGDDLFVEGLLDFSNEGVVDVEQEGEEAEEKKENEKDDCLYYGNVKEKAGFSVEDEFVSVHAGELSVPVDELANLEWLSHFVEDSFSEFSLQHLPPAKPQTLSEPETPAPKPAFLTSVPAKARSKRSRTGGRVWSLGSLPSTDSSSSSSSYSSSPSSSSSTSCLIFNRTGYEMFSYLGKPPKKPKKKPGSSSSSEPLQQQRRCSHCGVQKTPQWRTGPMGAKTLCNACGVRFKSGRLLPEYRPACSPTFSSQVHSNNHRKVLEMRRKKETVEQQPLVQNF